MVNARYCCCATYDRCKGSRGAECCFGPWVAVKILKVRILGVAGLCVTLAVGGIFALLGFFEGFDECCADIQAG
jgi:hypothetical protein